LAEVAEVAEGGTPCRHLPWTRPDNLPLMAAVAEEAAVVADKERRCRWPTHHNRSVFSVSLRTPLPRPWPSELMPSGSFASPRLIGF